MDEILQKIKAIGSIDNPLLTLGITDTSLPRVDNDLQVFLGATATTAQPAKEK